MSASDIDKLVSAPEATIVRHRGKCLSVANNARSNPKPGPLNP